VIAGGSLFVLIVGGLLGRLIASSMRRRNERAKWERSMKMLRWGANPDKAGRL
jgi:hypothetical protein